MLSYDDWCTKNEYDIQEKLDDWIANCPVALEGEVTNDIDWFAEYEKYTSEYGDMQYSIMKDER